MKSRPARSYGGKACLLLLCAPVMLGCAAVPGQSAEPEAGKTAGADMSELDAAAFVQELEALKAADVVALTPDEAMDEAHRGKRVRWAGAIHGIDRSSRGACLTIIFARSGDYGEPHWTLDPTYQTFVACGTGVYDPDLVHEFTNVTIVGTVSGKQFIGMGGGGSDGPVVEIERLYRWSDCLAGDISGVCRQGFLTAEPITDD